MSLLLAGFVIWKLATNGQLEVIPESHAFVTDLSPEEQSENILPSGTRMTQEKVAKIHGTLVGSECLQLRILYADADGQIATGSELLVGRGLRMGLSSRSKVEIDVFVNRSYSESANYVDFSLRPTGGRMTGKGRPLAVAKSDMKYHAGFRQILGDDTEAVIFAESESPIPDTNYSDFRGFQKSLKSPYLILLGRITRFGD